jgi:hypothetical protein
VIVFLFCVIFVGNFGLLHIYSLVGIGNDLKAIIIIIIIIILIIIIIIIIYVI